MKPHLRLVALVGLIVPRRLRADWRNEWEAELRTREALLAEWDRLDRRAKLDLLRRSAGAFWDALWLQSHRWEDDMIQDVRFGLRMMLNNPGVTFVCVVTLALGMGATTAIFSVVNAALLRPLPYPQADRLVVVYSTSVKDDGRGPISPLNYLAFKRENTTLVGLGAISNKGWPATLTGDGEPERLQGYQISADLFRTLGVDAAEGRTFLDEEDRPGAGHVVVLSHEFWQRRFGGDMSVVGSAVTLNDERYTIVGVMPADFKIFAKTDVWSPLAFTPKDELDDANYLEPIGRLRPGVTAEQASDEIGEHFLRTRAGTRSEDSRVAARPLQSLLTETVQRTLWILLAAVGFVLLIACANVSNLLLARGAVRRRELALRAALGAGRMRVVRQLLVESAMLAGAGAVLGLGLAYGLVRFVVAGLPDYLLEGNARLATLRPDGWAFGFALALAVVTTVVFGLVPALQSSKTDINETLKETGRGESHGRGQSRLRSALVMTEVALATILLVGAGLMLKSFWRLVNVDPGFRPAGALTAKIDPVMEFSQTVVFYDRFVERVGALPGVEVAGIINSLGSDWGYSIDERPPVPESEQPSALNNQVSEDYFRAMGIPLRAGRFFTNRDVESTPKVAIVDESFVRKTFPGEDPIGKHVKFLGASREIVGVVGAARLYTLSEEPYPHVYVPYRQENWGSMMLVVRARSGDPAALESAIRGALTEVDPNIPIHSFQTLGATVDEWNASQRFTASLMSAFAALAALIAAVGIYGVLAYSVTQREHEIGIRMALGAGRANVFRLVVGEGMIVVVAGLLIGTLGALALTRWMESLLFEVPATDPSTYAWICAIFAVVAALACYVPARRATKTDPIVALRHG